MRWRDDPVTLYITGDHAEFLTSLLYLADKVLADVLTLLTVALLVEGWIYDDFLMDYC